MTIKTEIQKMITAQMSIQEALETELHPDLAAHVYENETLGQVLSHPLVVSVFFLPGFCNAQYEQKKAALEIAREAKNWHTYVFLHERAYRMEALVYLWEGAYIDSDRELAKLAREIWIDSENIHQYVHEWEQLFHATDGDDWMIDSEREALATMPDEFTVYRGVCDDTGRSWTLDRNTAVFFANRQVNESTGELLTGTVKRSDVFAYLGSRGEEEILVLDSTDVNLTGKEDVS